MSWKNIHVRRKYWKTFITFNWCVFICSWRKARLMWERHHLKDAGGKDTRNSASIGWIYETLCTVFVRLNVDHTVHTTLGHIISTSMRWICETLRMVFVRWNWTTPPLGHMICASIRWIFGTFWVVFVRLTTPHLNLWNDFYFNRVNLWDIKHGICEVECGPHHPWTYDFRFNQMDFWDIMHGICEVDHTALEPMKWLLFQSSGLVTH